MPLHKLLNLGIEIEDMYNPIRRWEDHWDEYPEGLLPLTSGNGSFPRRHNSYEDARMGEERHRLEYPLIFQNMLSDIADLPEGSGDEAEKLGQLYDEIRAYNKAQKKSTVSDVNEPLNSDALYLAALNVMESGGFRISKKLRMNGIFSGIKKESLISKTFDEFAESADTAKSLEKNSNPAVYVLHSILEHNLQTAFTKDALKWYLDVSGKRLFDGFDWKCISQNTVSSWIIDVLPSKTGEDKHPELNAGESFQYVEKINSMLNALNLLKKAGADDTKIYQLVYTDITNHTERYFEVPKAVLIINDNTRLFKDKAVEKSLNVMGLIGNCKCEHPVSEIFGILDEYRRKEHPWRTYRRYDVSEIDFKINQLYSDFMAMRNMSKLLEASAAKTPCVFG